MIRYLLDANVFIQAKNLHYGFEFCPAFWDWLVVENESGKVASIEKVGDEIHAIEDELSKWAKGLGDGFFLPPDELVAKSLQRVSDWASASSYQSTAITTFLQVADYWLIAHALAYNYTVVTHEVPANTVAKIKIPNACIGLGLRCINPYEMLRREKAKFILGSNAGQP